VDSHQDIAWHALKYRRALARVPESVTAMVTLESLLRGGVGLSVATYFVDRETPRDMRKQHLRKEVEFYDSLPGKHPEVMQVCDRSDLSQLESRFSSGESIWGFCLLMEGAELIDSPEELNSQFERGVRMLSLTWNDDNQWASGARRTGGLKPAGRKLLARMDELGLILDVSHLNRHSFFEVLEAWHGPVVATHSNADALSPHFRNLTDEQLSLLKERGAVVGVLLGSAFLQPGWKEGDPQIPIAQVVVHIQHLIEHLGEHGVGIGSDFDGGLTPADTPEGLDSAADLPRIGDAMSECGLSEEFARNVLGGNWLRFLRDHLPQ